jgi:NAD-dependent dihydropyrimidine dehydrogenase PreA subunit
MSDRHTVWIDVQRCTGCGACVEVCPVEAIALANERAHIDPEICTGCDACIDACPEGAIQPVVEGELILAPQRPVPTVHQPSPLAETAGAAVVATGVGLLAKAAGALIRAIGQWPTRPSARAGSSAAKVPSLAQRRGEAGQGRQARHRRRGR